MNQPETTLSRLEKRSGFALASVYGCRLLGLFMVLPVLTLYVQAIPGTTGLQIGLAIGVYGIFQALLQIPFGILSDRHGRKPLIATGLLIFVIGSIICAFANQIEWFIVGRAIQGAGAIGSTVNALAADLTRPQLRSKIMMIIGIGVGGTFLIAMMLGPTLSLIVGIPGLFIAAALFGLLGLIVLFKLVPTPTAKLQPILRLNWQTIKPVLFNTNCICLDFSIFILHATLTISFVVIPLMLAEFNLAAKYVGMIYVPILLASFLVTLPALSYAEKHSVVKRCLFIAIILLGICQLGLALFTPSIVIISLLLFGFFTAFVFLEANLPALITRVAPSEHRGMATGIFSAAQFCGIFVGGLVGGLLYQHSSIAVVLGVSAGVSAIWLLIVMPLQIPIDRK